MPYSIAKKLGGDTKTVDARMERCVADLTAAGHSKQSAIRICKASQQKRLASQKTRGAQILDALKRNRA